MDKKRKHSHTHTHLDQQSLDKTMNHLSLLFDRVTGSFKTAQPSKGTLLYDHQVEFSYLMDEIMRGPVCFQQKNISVCYDFVNGLNAQKKASER